MTDLSEILREAPRNCWLALSHDDNTIVGTGKDIQEAIKSAKESGEDDPVLIWAPAAWIPDAYTPPLA